MTVRGARVLVTGASRGLGRLFTERAAREGAAEVLLWGRDAAALAEVRGHLPGPTAARTAVVDLADSAALDAAAAEVLAGGPPDVVVNNAGTITGNTYFWETDPDDAARTLEVNTLAPMRLLARLLPAMLVPDRPRRILNVASAAGLLPNPRMSVYAASKAATYSWSDTLRMELAQAGHAHLRVTTALPSFIDTGMFAGAGGVRLSPTLAPERVVDQAWRAMLAGRAQVVAPPSVHLARALRGLLPPPAWDALARAMGISRSMEGFTGRG
ncbi:SDR family NAD(P)-dependent oxidoreductase [Georgenia sp. TF02-10]|uniref:SDR family NAD(P)-dependent oxidoreductase n=1 Tax=Georgenia sp. TF02-10 TaxID=2917725 RepID=UPI001FA777AA|nr:SDR family NAD(P)-dependent oxidoreductase [Georgenia sp. TF02-10]UNX55534.1 SDR family NAD(P)-dependent oxidoreductase [Georgenia sp. TF02-10]